MTTEAQVRANRANSKRSTGPTSRDGKSKVAANAFRHGLAMPLSAFREFDEPVARLAKLLIGSSEEGRLAVAESVVGLARIRRLKLSLLDQAQRTNFEGHLDELEKLERYERRALSRCKSAIRDLQSAA